MKSGRPKGWKAPEMSGPGYGGGCPPEMRSFGRDLYDFFNSPDVFELLGNYATWSEGGCWIAAEALKRWMRPHAELWAVHDGANILHHVVVRLGDCFIDANGIFTEEEMLRFWAEEEGLVEPRLRPFSKQQAIAFQLDCPRDVVERLTKALEEDYGPWMAV